MFYGTTPDNNTIYPNHYVNVDPDDRPLFLLRSSTDVDVTHEQLRHPSSHTFVDRSYIQKTWSTSS